jgi:hypothetical protein
MHATTNEKISSKLHDQQLLDNPEAGGNWPTLCLQRLLVARSVRHSSPPMYMCRSRGFPAISAVAPCRPRRHAQVHRPCPPQQGHEDTPINEALVRALAGGGFIAEQRNSVLVGATGTGETHLAIAIARNCIRAGYRGRFFTTVDLVNRLEAEARAGRQGRIADYLTRMDFIILDELGYLPFAQSGGQLLFHLVSRLYERTSLIVTTISPLANGRAFSEIPI